MESIKKQRQKEIALGENLSTRNPIYVVYDQIYTVCEHDTIYEQNTTHFSVKEKFVRHDYNGGEKAAEPYSQKWYDKVGKWSPVVKKSFHDRFVTVCFTRQAAKDFIEAERHNLTNPRIFVEYAQTRNKELLEVLKALGD